MANWEGADMMTTGAMVSSENWSNVTPNALNFYPSFQYLTQAETNIGPTLNPKDSGILPAAPFPHANKKRIELTLYPKSFRLRAT